MSVPLVPVTLPRPPLRLGVLLNPDNVNQVLIRTLPSFTKLKVYELVILRKVAEIVTI